MASRRQSYAIAALLLAASLLLISRLGATDLWAPDEPRYAQIAEELRSMRHGAPGLLLLHSNGEPYTQKPPLYYWLAAGFGAARGEVDEVAARLPSALAGIACVLFTLLLGRRLFSDPRVGLWAGAILLTTFRHAHLARRAQLDVLLALFELLALIAFWRLDSKQGNARWNLIGLHAALALALLTKGPVGLLPLLVIGVFLALEGRGREMLRLLPPWSPLLALGPLLLWFAAALTLAPSGFFGEAVVENLIGRFFGGSSHARPFYYFLYQFPIDFLPWSLLWPLAALTTARALRGQEESAATPGNRRALRLLLVWVAVSLVFFSLSAGKRGLYLLPTFPAAALLTGHALVQRLYSDETPHALFAAFALIAGFLFGIGAWVGLSGGLEVPGAPGFDLSPAFGAALVAISVCWATGELWMRSRQRAPSQRVLLAIAAWLAAIASVFTLAYPGFDDAKSPRPVAVAALVHSAADAPIGIFDQRPLVGGIALYSGRKVVHLQTPPEVAGFLAKPGRVVILRARKLERLAGEVEPLQVRARLREGRRELLIATPRRKPLDL